MNRPEDWGETAAIATRTARRIRVLARWARRLGAPDTAERIAGWADQIADLGDHGRIMERAAIEGRAAPGGEA